MIISALLFAFFFVIESRYLPENRTTAIPNPVEEIQHAVCKVATEEIQASANASITRQLRGVCSSRAMNARFNELERLLVREIEEIKLMLQSGGYTTPKPYRQEEIFTKYAQSYEDYDYLNEIENYTQAIITKSLDYSKRNNSKPLQNLTQIIEDNKNKLNTTTVRNKNSSIQSGRDKDVIKYNETIQNTDIGKAFLYYWKMYDINNILREDVYLMSPSIDFLGQMLNIKFSSRHLGANYVNIELVSSRYFIRTHRFVLLHEDAKQDLNSQLLGNVKKYATSFRISKDKIQSFTKDDILYVKLLIYMNF